MRIKGIVFDIIDTLVYINGPVYDEYREKTARYAGITKDDYESVWSGFRNERIRGEISGMKAMMQAVLDKLNITGSDPEVMADMEISGIKASLVTYPGTEQMLENLTANGYRLALISNSGENVEKAVEEIPWIKFFDAVIFSSRARIAKPDPAIYALASEKLGLKPESCIFAGDGDSGELDGAGKAGMATVRVAQPHQSLTGKMSEKYDYTIDAIWMLPEVLQEMEDPAEAALKNPRLAEFWKMLEEKDSFTARHARRVAGLLKEFALGSGFSEEEADRMKVAGLLHDLGKLNLPDSIFGKLQDGTRINTEEINLIKTHADLPDFLKKIEEIPPFLADAIKHHHERYDGTGYPQGLKGDEIPLSVRMLSVADFYDTIVVQRQWKTPGLQKPLDKKDALRLLVEESHTRLDPELVSRFVSIISGKN